MHTILAQKGNLSSDWDREKKIHSGKYGYLNVAINHPDILKETKLIKRLVKSFNKSRESIWKFKDVIRSYHKKKPEFIKVKQIPPTDSSSGNKVASRLFKKVSPYNERDFKIISSRAFLSPHIREILSKWEEDPSKPVNITEASYEVIEASYEVIENLKLEYPKLQKWDNQK